MANERASPNLPPSPTKQQVQQARKAWSAKVGRAMSSYHCAAVIYVSQRTWQKYEAGETNMPPGLFELFRIKTGQF